MKRLGLSILFVVSGVLGANAQAQESYDDTLEIFLLGVPVENGGLGVPPAAGGDAVLREDSGYVLREDGGKILRE